MLVVTADSTTQVNKGTLKSFSRISIADQDGNKLFGISGVKLLDGANGLYAAMPSYKGSDNTYHTSVEVSHNLSKAIANAIISGKSANLAVHGEAIRPSTSVFPTPDNTKQLASVKVDFYEGKRQGNSFVMNDHTLLTIKGAKLRDGENGRFVAMPSDIGKDGKFHDVVYISDAALKALTQERAVAQYDSKANVRETPQTKETSSARKTEKPGLHERMDKAAQKAQTASPQKAAVKKAPAKKTSQHDPR
jgi:DNA-binding cell septation regulator SpoVG